MRGVLTTLVLLVAGVSAAEGPRDLTNYNFEAFLVEHGKAYDSEEYRVRSELFEARLKTILAHNEGYRRGEHTWWMAANHLADLTVDEFKRLRMTEDAWQRAWDAPRVELSEHLQNETANPDSVDWRLKDKVTAVKNQGGCGSCWAFAATETIESHYAIASGKLLTLAPQAMVNCVKNPHSCGGVGGCGGATEEMGFELAKHQGIPLEADLPYQGKNVACTSYKAAVKATGYVKIAPTNNGLALETALATRGPIAVTVAAEPWMLYGGGVFTGCSKSSSGADLDHGVQAVGYSQDYWLIRNSWGPAWGEKGYIRLTRAADSKTFTDTTPAHGIACKPYPATQTVGGECGVLFDASYPTGTSVATSEVLV